MTPYRGIISAEDASGRAAFDNTNKKVLEVEKMNKQTNENTEDSRWLQKPKVLSSMDMRTFGMQTCKTNLAKLWKNGGLGVLAILRADRARELMKEKQDEESERKIDS